MKILLASYREVRCAVALTVFPIKAGALGG